MKPEMMGIGEAPAEMNALAKLANIDDLVTGRDHAIEELTGAYDAFHSACEIAKAASIGGAVHFGAPMSDRYGDNGLTAHFLRVGDTEHRDHETGTRVKSTARADYIQAVTYAVDRGCWSGLMNQLGFDTLLDRQAREEFAASIRDKPPVFNAENCAATFGNVWGNRREMYLRGIANVFMAMDRRFRSHDAFEIGNRLVIERAFSDWGSWENYNRRDTLHDVERIFRELDEAPAVGVDSGIAGDLQRTRRSATLPCVVDGEYFRARVFKNGNIHLWFTRKDLLKQVNALLLEYYKPVEGDVSENGPSYESGPAYHSTPAKHYGFFPSPAAVVEEVVSQSQMYGRADCTGRMRDDWKPSRVLEPSAGTGALADAARAKGHEVVCVEVQPHLAHLLRSKGYDTREADFLRMHPGELGLFDHIIMNPPFDRGRDCDHVRHAWQFLKPGGTLVAVMSARAEHATDARHKALHDLIERETDGRARWAWRDLPEKSFASEGTNVNTVTLTLRKKWKA